MTRKQRAQPSVETGHDVTSASEEPARQASDESEKRQVFLQSLLETSRTKWQHGEWEQLAKLDIETVARDVERAKLALIVAAACSHVGDMEAARSLTRQAIEWGCEKRIAAKILISAAQNSLGRASACMDDENDAREHFEEAIRILEPRADVRLLGRTRQIRETARMGLLPEAAQLLDRDLTTLAESPADNTARMTVLKTEIDLLKHELMISLKRGQLYNADQISRSANQTPATGPDDLQRRAVSQLGQELWVLERLNYKRGGFFVEFGATDGVTLSNTWLLEAEFGWKGLCAEPNPRFLEALNQNRRCTVVDACIGARTGDTVDFILADVYGGIADYVDIDKHEAKREAYRSEGKVLQLKTVSLNDFLRQHDAPKEIDYLSIDTEGSEYDILKAFPFDQWTIRLITVEHNFTQQREKIRALLEAQGYVRTEAQWDDWYELVR